MFAINQTLLPPSAIHHSLFLPNFTPSTIYPLPRSSLPDAPEVKVVGNLVVAGGQDIRVFEIREEKAPVMARGEVNGGGDVGEAEMEELGDSFFDSGPTEVSATHDFRHAHLVSVLYECGADADGSKRAPVRYETTRRLHLVCQHQLHGEITGLAALRTIESSVDGLDRLLVSFKSAKVSFCQLSSC
jgi:cleavage and polyadenylation specificity factor subunit 1